MGEMIAINGSHAFPSIEIMMLKRIFSALIFVAVVPCLFAADTVAEKDQPMTVDVDGAAWNATTLVHERFTDPDWKSRWFLEGNADVMVRDGRLMMVTAKPKQIEQAATLWWREALPADLLVEVVADIAGSVADNAANVNLFFHARERDGAAYRFGRSGRYADYHEIPNYIMTLTGGFQEGWARMRRNPGFNLISEDKTIRSEVGKTYRIRVLIAGGRLRYWINGRLIHDVRDSTPLPGGHFALRTWRSQIEWSDVKIFALTPPAVSPRT